MNEANMIDAPTEAPEPEPKGTAPKAPRKKRAAKKSVAAPKTATTRNENPTGRKPKEVGDAQSRARRVTALYEQLGTGLTLGGIALGNENVAAAGEAMSDNASALGEAWANAATHSPRIAKLIDSISTGGSIGALVLAHAPIVRAIMEGPSDDSAVGMMSGLMDMMNGAAES